MNGGESQAKSPEVVARPRPKSAKLKPLSMIMVDLVKQCGLKKKLELGDTYDGFLFT